MRVTLVPPGLAVAFPRYLRGSSNFFRIILAHIHLLTYILMGIIVITQNMCVWKERINKIHFYHKERKNFTYSLWFAWGTQSLQLLFVWSSWFESYLFWVYDMLLKIIASNPMDIVFYSTKLFFFIVLRWCLIYDVKKYSFISPETVKIVV